MSARAGDVIVANFTADLRTVVHAALLKAFRSGFDTAEIAGWADVSEASVCRMLAEARAAESAAHAPAPPRAGTPASPGRTP